MTVEDVYGQMWQALARREGHMKQLPRMPREQANPGGRKPKVPFEVIVAALKEGGTHAEIAARIGVCSSRVSQVAAKLRRAA